MKNLRRISNSKNCKNPIRGGAVRRHAQMIRTGISIREPQNMIRAVIKIFAALLAVVAESALAKPITLAYNTNSLNVTLPIQVAQELGFFTGEGFEVIPVYVRSGPTAMTALVSGSADYAIVGSTTVVQAIAKGIPAVVIGNYLRRVNWVLMGGAGVTTLNSIKGQVVGVTSAGGMTEFLTIEALARRGFKRDRDYRVHYAGNSPARVAALEARIIQAAAFSPGERVVLEPKGFSVLMNMVQVVPEFPLSILASSRHKLDTNATEVEAFLRALHRAMEVIRTDKDRAIAAAFKKAARSDLANERKALDYLADDYSIVITKENIQALIYAAGVDAEARKLGGAEKFFAAEPQARAVSRR
jgi:NitT/TauT family transport system substrate-binding protein